MLFNFTNGRIFYHKLLHYGVIISSKDETLKIFLIDTFKDYTVDSSKFYEDIDDTFVSSMTLKIALNLRLYIPLLSDNNNINNYDYDIRFELILVPYTETLKKSGKSIDTIIEEIDSNKRSSVIVPLSLTHFFEGDAYSILSRYDKEY